MCISANASILCMSVRTAGRHERQVCTSVVHTAETLLYFTKKPKSALAIFDLILALKLNAAVLKSNVLLLV